jgi:hypothetical protein
MAPDERRRGLKNGIMSYIKAGVSILAFSVANVATVYQPCHVWLWREDISSLLPEKISLAGSLTASSLASDYHMYHIWRRMASRE